MAFGRIFGGGFRPAFDAGGAAAASTLLTGLVAYWPLSNVNDSLGVNNLTNNNAVTFVAGKVSNAANFVAASSQSLSGASAPFNLYPMTLSFWINVSSNVPVDGVGGINKYVGGSANGWNAYVRPASIPLYSVCFWYFKDGSNYVYDGAFGDAILVAYAAGWQHIIWTVDASGHQAWLNNVSKFTRAWTGTPGATTSAQVLRLGYYDAYLTGLLDEVGIWNRALTVAERATLYNGGTGITYPF